MPVAKLKAAANIPDAMKSDGNDSLDTFIRQAIGKEPSLSFPKAGDSSVQWIQLLHALDQQGTSNFSHGLKINNFIEGKERSLEYFNGLSSYASEVNAFKDSVHHIKSGDLPVKGTENASEHKQLLKFPEAVAFAQSPAKANDLPGWPLLSPLKVQMQKCDKCSQEFFSPINYRRHIRVHHRLKRPDKDSTKNRDLLGAFWDKLSFDDAKEIVSFNEVTLEDVPGSTIVEHLASLIQKPGISALPQLCWRAGSALLDIVQSRPSRFPMSSQKLFSILDDASERTFLHGTAVLMQKYVFDGEAGKIGLETKNLVSCTSFLVEQKLVKAWLADKEAEALRCQKLLVEEEEAAQKRQAELLERKRQKKIRQKEQKATEQRCGEKVDIKEIIGESLEAAPPAETSSPLAPSDSDTHTADMPPAHVPLSLGPFSLSNPDVEAADTEAQTGSGSGFTDPETGQNVERRPVQGSGRRHTIVARWQAPQKSLRGVPNGFHATLNSHASKLGVMQKHGSYREVRAAPIVNGNKVWSWKPKPENDGEKLKTRVQKETVNQPDQNKIHEVLIGTISVTLENCSQQESNNLAVIPDDCLSEHQIPRKNNFQEKPIKPDTVQGGTNRSTVKLWRPVSRHGAKGTIPVQNGNTESELDVSTDRVDNQTLSNESCQRPCAMEDNDNGQIGNNSSLLEESMRPDSSGLSIQAAKAFLAERWKGALAGDHVKLVLSPESEPPGGCLEIQSECQAGASLPSDNYNGSILGNAENRLGNAGGTAKARFRTKHEKGVKIKYIPKQRTVT